MAQRSRPPLPLPRIELLPSDIPWAVMTHASLALALFHPYLGPVVGPVWALLARGSRSPRFANQAVETLNVGVLMAAVSGLTSLLFLLTNELDRPMGGTFLEVLVTLPGVTAGWIGARRARRGEGMRYPLPFRLVKPVQLLPRVADDGTGDGTHTGSVSATRPVRQNRAPSGPKFQRSEPWLRRRLRLD